MTVIPNPTYFSVFPRLKIKLKGRHFDTVEVIGTPLQTTTSRMHLKKSEALGTVHTRVGDYFESDSGQWARS
jgi:hypothetical protein